MAVAELYVNAGKKGLDTELTSMLAHPVVTKARNRSSHGYARGVRHQSHRIFRAERESLRSCQCCCCWRMKPAKRQRVGVCTASLISILRTVFISPFLSM